MSSSQTVIVLGGTGLIGSAVVARLAAAGHRALPVGSATYAAAVGAPADVVVNCNGNAYRFKANRDPRWDFEASVATVERSLFDFQPRAYVFVSTIDVYNVLDDPARNHEAAPIEPARLDAYGFHKWLAERLVERFAARGVIFRTGTAVGPGLKKGPLFDVLHRRPVFMSPASRLSLIDTATVARAVERVAFDDAARGIYNLTGSGAVSVRELGELAGAAPQVAPSAAGVVHRYDVSNAKSRGLLPLPTSREVAEQFFRAAAAAGAATAGSPPGNP